MDFRIRAMVFAGESVECDSEVVRIAVVDGATLVTLRQRVTVAGRTIVDDATLELQVAPSG